MNLLLPQSNRPQMKLELVVLISKIFFFFCFILATNLLNLSSCFSKTKKKHLRVDFLLDLGQLCNKCDP